MAVSSPPVDSGDYHQETMDSVVEESIARGGGSIDRRQAPCPGILVV